MKCIDCRDPLSTSLLAEGELKAIVCANCQEAICGWCYQEIHQSTCKNKANKQDTKYWVYIENVPENVRIFDKGNGAHQILIRVASQQDADKIKEILERVGHLYIKTGKNFNV